MTLSDELRKNGWDIHWVGDDKSRELLYRLFRFSGIATSANATVIAAKLALEYKLEKEVYFRVSDWDVLVFLNAYNDGPLDENFYTLAKAIESQFAKLSTAEVELDKTIDE